MMEVLKGSLEMKKKEQDQARELRERELNLMNNQLKRQEEFTRSMMEQQQQFQPQQQNLEQNGTNAGK